MKNMKRPWALLQLLVDLDRRGHRALPFRRGNWTGNFIQSYFFHFFLSFSEFTLIFSFSFISFWIFTISFSQSQYRYLNLWILFTFTFLSKLIYFHNFVFSISLCYLNFWISLLYFISFYKLSHFFSISLLLL